MGVIIGPYVGAGGSYVPDQLVQNPLIYLDASSNLSYPGTGDTWYDLSGNNHNGTLTNISHTGNSMYFPGTGWVATPHARLVNLGNNFTIFVMAKVASAAGYHPFFSTYHNYASTSIWGLAFLSANDTNFNMRNNQLRCYVGSAAWANRFACSNTSTVAASWKMYAVVCTNFGSNQNYTYYTDGNNAAGFYWWSIGGQSAAYWFANQNDAIASCFIGRQRSAPDPGYWNSTSSPMDMGVFMIYTSALTGTQIQQNFDFFRGRYGI